MKREAVAYDPFLNTRYFERHTMRKILVISMVFLLSGCSLSHYGAKSPLEIEQYENPMTWKEMYRIQVALWPLEKKVNEMSNELATIKLSSMQANKNIESLRAEIKQMKSESVRKEKTSVDTISPSPEMQQEVFKSSEEYIKRKTDELQTAIKNKKEMLKPGATKLAEESKKAGPDIQSVIINDIQYYKVSDTQDKVLIYVSAMNNPKLQTLQGEDPRIVLDFFNARNNDKEKYEINTDGNFIKRIRVRSYKEPIQKVRVVFDMAPNKKYSVEHKFSKNENIYSFDIKTN
jgi:hypothetical protein